MGEFLKTAFSNEVSPEETTVLVGTVNGAEAAAIFSFYGRNNFSEDSWKRLADELYPSIQWMEVKGTEYKGIFCQTTVITYDNPYNCVPQKYALAAVRGGTLPRNNFHIKGHPEELYNGYPGY